MTYKHVVACLTEVTLTTDLNKRKLNPIHGKSYFWGSVQLALANNSSDIQTIVYVTSLTEGSMTVHVRTALDNKIMTPAMLMEEHAGTLAFVRRIAVKMKLNFSSFLIAQRYSGLEDI